MNERELVYVIDVEYNIHGEFGNDYVIFKTKDKAKDALYKLIVNDLKNNSQLEYFELWNSDLPEVKPTKEFSKDIIDNDNLYQISLYEGESVYSLDFISYTFIEYALI